MIPNSCVILKKIGIEKPLRWLQAYHRVSPTFADIQNSIKTYHWDYCLIKLTTGLTLTVTVTLLLLLLGSSVYAMSIIMVNM